MAREAFIAVFEADSTNSSQQLEDRFYSDMFDWCSPLRNNVTNICDVLFTMLILLLRAVQCSVERAIGEKSCFICRDYFEKENIPFIQSYSKYFVLDVVALEM